jgi:thymidine kinase
MSLHITLGCMYASKTSSLIQKYNTFRFNRLNVIVLDYDTQRNPKYYDDELENHNGVKIPCIKCSKLMDLLNIYKKRGNFQISHEFDPLNDFALSQEMNETRDALLNAEYIMINEAQFYPDLVEFVKHFKTKNIYVYGLDGDFKQEKIGQILDIIPLCDSVRKLKAVCACGEPAIFSKRLSDETEQYQPNAQYLPVCRKCI